VPTIHVTDLARMVKKIYETKPEKSYIFGVDNTKRPRQKKLIAALSNGVGTGLIESIDEPDKGMKLHPKKTPLQLELDWRIPMMLDLKLKPSSLFVSQNEEEEPVEFDWHSKTGLSQNIQKVKEEFCKERGLKPVKILITGPPCSGKSFYGKQLAEHYDVPHIHLGKMIEDIQNWNAEKEKSIYAKRDEKKKVLEAIEKEKIE
jgi:adenylate kinase